MYERLFSLKLPFRSIRKPTDHSRHDSHGISVLYLNTTTVPKDLVRPLRVLKMGNFEMLTISATTRKISALALLPLRYQRTSHIHYRCEDIKWIAYAIWHNYRHFYYSIPACKKQGSVWNSKCYSISLVTVHALHELSLLILLPENKRELILRKV